MENAETWVVLLQLSREDGEINPCNVLVGHWSIRELDGFKVFVEHLDVISSGIVIPCVSD